MLRFMYVLVTFSPLFCACFAHFSASLLQDDARKLFLFDEDDFEVREPSGGREESPPFFVGLYHLCREILSILVEAR